VVCNFKLNLERNIKFAVRYTLVLYVPCVFDAPRRSHSVRRGYDLQQWFLLAGSFQQ
jgi:hypothetical protein